MTDSDAPFFLTGVMDLASSENTSSTLSSSVECQEGSIVGLVLTALSHELSSVPRYYNYNIISVPRYYNYNIRTYILQLQHPYLHFTITTSVPTFYNYNIRTYILQLQFFLNHKFKRKYFRKVKTVISGCRFD